MPFHAPNSDLVRKTIKLTMLLCETSWKETLLSLPLSVLEITAR